MPSRQTLLKFWTFHVTLTTAIPYFHWTFWLWWCIVKLNLLAKEPLFWRFNQSSHFDCISHRCDIDYPGFFAQCPPHNKKTQQNLCECCGQFLFTVLSSEHCHTFWTFQNHECFPPIDWMGLIIGGGKKKKILFEIPMNMNEWLPVQSMKNDLQCSEGGKHTKLSRSAGHLKTIQFLLLIVQNLFRKASSFNPLGTAQEFQLWLSENSGGCCCFCWWPTQLEGRRTRLWLSGVCWHNLTMLLQPSPSPTVHAN